jgi:WD40 repeat protein
MAKPSLSRLAVFLIAAAVILIHAAPAPAAVFPTEPMLRIETGMHNGSILNIATDAANRYLVSGGPDKTVRLWSLPQLELLKTLRPPSGKGPEGFVSAVAMAPDGSQIAVGGEFCKPYEGWYGAFIFDTASGRIVKRLTRFDDRVSALAWSPDGVVLAAGMRGRGGLRLLRSSDWAEIGRDKDYAGPITAIHFDGRGRLAAASWDGSIRLYGHDGNGLKVIRTKAASAIQHTQFRGVKSQNRGRPTSLQFSPDGSKLAVGHVIGSNWVAVLSTDTLDPLYMASTEGLVEQGIQRLAWSPDGKTLFASTGAAERKPQVVRKWGDGGRGSPKDLPAGTDTQVTGLLALQDGSVVFSTSGSSIGRYDSGGNRTAFHTARSGNFYDSTEEFKISKDGARIEFAYDGNGQGILNFDIRARRLAAGAVKDEPMTAPVVNAGSLRFYKAWRNTRGALEIGNKKLGMGPLEISRSLAISPDLSSVVVGTDIFLRHYSSKDGTPLWAVPVGTLAVNVSGDGRLVVGASPLGFIHWYRRTDGKLLLSLFVASDKKRWVLVSPSGFYDTSVGGEELVGWQVNRGREQAADFFPVSRLRARFYRPEVIAGIVEKADDADAFRLAAEALGGGTPVVAAEVQVQPQPVTPPVVAATPSAPAAQPGRPEPPEPGEGISDAEEASAGVATPVQVVSDVTRVLPPVVTILSPPSGSVITNNVVKVRYMVRSAPDAPVTSVRSRVNGLAQDSRSVQVVAREEVREVAVPVPSEDSEVLLFAENKHGVSSAASIRLYWRGAAPSPASVSKPVLYVLAVGISQYQKPEYRLQYAAKDAGDFVRIVNQQKGKYYSDVVVKLLTDDAALNGDVIQGFDWLQKQVTPKDVGMVFIAGHGVTDERGNYFFLPFNADLDALARTGVPFSEIKSRLANLSGKGLLFVDTCHSGNVMGSRKGLSSDVTGVLNELSSAEYSLVVIASSTGRQASLENESWGNGAFTKALVEGLAGQADLKKRGRITHKMLDFYVSDRVEELTKGQQTPVNASPQGVPDFTIAIVVSPAS